MRQTQKPSPRASVVKLVSISGQPRRLVRFSCQDWLLKTRETGFKQLLQAFDAPEGASIEVEGDFNFRVRCDYYYTCIAIFSTKNDGWWRLHRVPITT